MRSTACSNRTDVVSEFKWLINSGSVTVTSLLDGGCSIRPGGSGCQVLQLSGNAGAGSIAILVGDVSSITMGSICNLTVWYAPDPRASVSSSSFQASFSTWTSPTVSIAINAGASHLAWTPYSTTFAAPMSFNFLVFTSTSISQAGDFHDRDGVFLDDISFSCKLPTTPSATLSSSPSASGAPSLSAAASSTPSLSTTSSMSASATSSCGFFSSCSSLPSPSPSLSSTRSAASSKSNIPSVTQRATSAGTPGATQSVSSLPSWSPSPRPSSSPSFYPATAYDRVIVSLPLDACPTAATTGSGAPPSTCLLATNAGTGVIDASSAGTASASAPSCSGCALGAYVSFVSGECVPCPLASSSRGSLAIVIAICASIFAVIALLSATTLYLMRAPVLLGVRRSLEFSGSLVAMLQLLASAGASVGRAAPSWIVAVYGALGPLIIEGAGMPPQCEPTAAGAYSSQLQLFALALVMLVTIIVLETWGRRRRGEPWPSAALSPAAAPTSATAPDPSARAAAALLTAPAATGLCAHVYAAARSALLRLSGSPPVPLKLRMQQLGAGLIAALFLLMPIVLRAALQIVDCRSVSLPATDAALLEAWNGVDAAAKVAAPHPSRKSLRVLTSQPYLMCDTSSHALAAFLAWAVLLLVATALPIALLVAFRLAILRAFALDAGTAIFPRSVCAATMASPWCCAREQFPRGVAPRNHALSRDSLLLLASPACCYRKRYARLVSDAASHMSVAAEAVGRRPSAEGLVISDTRLRRSLRSYNPMHAAADPGGGVEAPRALPNRCRVDSRAFSARLARLYAEGLRADLEHQAAYLDVGGVGGLRVAEGSSAGNVPGKRVRGGSAVGARALNVCTGSASALGGNGARASSVAFIGVASAGTLLRSPDDVVTRAGTAGGGRGDGLAPPPPTGAATVAAATANVLRCVRRVRIQLCCAGSRPPRPPRTRCYGYCACGRASCPCLPFERMRRHVPLPPTAADVLDLALRPALFVDAFASSGGTSATAPTEELNSASSPASERRSFTANLALSSPTGSARRSSTSSSFHRRSLTAAPRAILPPPSSSSQLSSKPASPSRTASAASSPSVSAESSPPEDLSSEHRDDSRGAVALPTGARSTELSFCETCGRAYTESRAEGTRSSSRMPQILSSAAVAIAATGRALASSAGAAARAALASSRVPAISGRGREASSAGASAISLDAHERAAGYLGSLTAFERTLLISDYRPSSAYFIPLTVITNSIIVGAAALVPATQNADASSLAARATITVLASAVLGWALLEQRPFLGPAAWVISTRLLVLGLVSGSALVAAASASCNAALTSALGVLLLLLFAAFTVTGSAAFLLTTATPVETGEIEEIAARAVTHAALAAAAAAARERRAATEASAAAAGANHAGRTRSRMLAFMIEAAAGLIRRPAPRSRGARADTAAAALPSDLRAVASDALKPDVAVAIEARRLRNVRRSTVNASPLAMAVRKVKPLPEL